MSFEEHLDVQEAGGFSIVRFRNDINEVGDRAEDVFEALRRFASTYGCLKIAIDVSTHPYLPSSVLGLLIRLHTQEGGRSSSCERTSGSGRDRSYHAARPDAARQ